MSERIPFKVVITRTVTTVESVERTVFAESEDDARVLGRYQDVTYWSTGPTAEVIKVTSVQRQPVAIAEARPDTYAELAQRVAQQVAAGDARN